MSKSESELLKLSSLERVNTGEKYYSVAFAPYACPNSFIENCNLCDNIQFKVNNYYKTERRAKEVSEKINLLLKLERLHDIFCPEYTPDWENPWLSKYYIYQDKSVGNIWIWGEVSTESDAVQVYFPREEIAQRVCDILNAEMKEKQ